VEQMALVPCEGAVQQFASAGLYPALHDGIHPGVPCQNKSHVL
jgi:hypothetical protein